MAILILGATSEIAEQNVEIFASRGEHLILAARRVESLPNLPENSAQNVYYDAEETFQDFLSAELFWLQCAEIARINWDEEIEGIYIAQGFLPSSDRMRWGDEIGETIFLNFTSITFFLEAAAHWFESHTFKPETWIAVISSVAGDRGRFSNYPYGAAKAGLTAYLSGLRARLHPLGIHVLTIKPGLVKTRMIYGRPQEKSLTAASPQKIARQIDTAISLRQNVLYTPHYWRWVMALVCSIPEWIFKKIKF